jgi:hypothetical protein
MSYASSSVAKMAQLGTPTRMSDANQLRANGRLPAFVCETAMRPRRASARSRAALLVAISTAVLGALDTFPFCFCCFCFCSFFCCFLSLRRRRGDWRDFAPCLSCRIIACIGHWAMGPGQWAMGIGTLGQRGVGKRP